MGPTPAFDNLIESGIKPHFALLRAIIKSLFKNSVDDEAIGMCAASVIGQCFHFHHCRYVINKLAPEHSLNEKNLPKIAKHITNFTIAAISHLSEDR